jgi:hypothetical protein
MRHLEGFGDPSPGIMAKGLYKRQKVGYATLVVFCTIRLIAFGIDC